MSGKKESRIKKYIPQILRALLDRLRGKDIRKQLDFLLNPKTIETSSRLSSNEIMAINQADWFGRQFHRFRSLREFWVGVSDPKGLFVKGKGGRYTRWVISKEGKGREESINFIGASKEQNVIAPVLSALGVKKEDEKK